MRVEPLAVSDPPQVGRFRCVGVLGSGGMGRVLLGVGADDRLVAIKLVHPHLADRGDFRERFRREITASARVSGAFTAPIVDADPDADRPWFATVYVPGPTLGDAVADNGRLPPDSVRALAIGLARALRDIHRAGLVHRDLKPSNVLLAADGPRVIDFGVALSTEVASALTQAGDLLGSPNYMSPEQALSQPATTASDVYALGAVVTLAARGRPPFTGPTVPAMLYAVIHGEPDLSGVAAEFAPILAACLRKDPAGRPSLDAIVEAFSPVRHGESPWPASIVREVERRKVLESGGGRKPVHRLSFLRSKKLVGVVVALAVAVGAAAVATGRVDRSEPADAEPAVTAAPPVVSLSDLRDVDACVLLRQSVDGESAIDPESPSGWGSCTVRAGGLTYDLTLATWANTDVTADGAERSASGFPMVTASASGLGCVLDADPTATGDTVTSLRVRTDGAEACPLGRQVLGRALDRLPTDPPRAPEQPGSLSRRDPCTLADTASLQPIVGVPGNGAARTLYRCEWQARQDISIQIGADIVPVEGDSVTTVDGHEVFEDTSAGFGSTCVLVYRHPVGDGFEAVSVGASGAVDSRETYCDTARAVVATVIPRLG